MRIPSKRLFWLTLVIAVAGLAGLAITGSASAQAVPCADLVITDFAITPAQPVVGKNAVIDVTVRNQGTCTSLGFVVQWKSNLFAPTGPSSFVPSLAAGASTKVSFDFAFPRAGDFTTIATVDSDNTVNETNESNNVEILAVTVLADLPDLVITNFTINPEEPVEGLNATINITVKNQGTLPAGGFVVQWKSDQFAPTGPSQHVAGLGPGQSTTVSFDYAFPRPGNFTTMATVDSSNTVQESNERNNLEILSTTVQKAEIDLVITIFKVEPAPGVPVSDPPLPVQGRLTLVTIIVKNQGNFPAGDFVVEWKPTQLAPDLSKQVNGLDPGKSEIVTFLYTYPLAGKFTTTATVDSTHKVRETNELNNRRSKLVTVEPQRPDLVITMLTINPAKPVRGSTARVTAVVKNRGNTPAGRFVVEWKPKPLAPGLAKQVNFLGVGKSKILTFDYTYTSVGTFISVAEVDSTNRVLELDEDNNSKILPVTVQIDTRDLVITDMSIDPDPPRQGSIATVSITIKNQGNSPSGPFVLEWNPDTLGLITPSPSTLSSQIDNLDGGQSRRVDFHYTYPKAGNFRTVAKVDAFNSVRETNEDNNLRILNVTVEESAPDLVITDLTINPAQPTQGALAHVSITVRNQGNAPAGPFVVEWNPDALGLITPSPATLSAQVNGLGANQSTTVEFDYIYPKSGNFRTIARVDAFNSVQESNEANNLSILNVIVEPGIDLVVQLTLPAEVMRGTKVTAQVKVMNLGIYPAGTFWVQWKPDETKPGGPVAKVDGLGAGQSTTVSIEGTYLQTGQFASVAIVDIYNQVVESNEDNNESNKQTVNVIPRVTELKVTFNSVKVFQAFEDGIDGNAEWWLWFFVLDPDATCKIGGETIKSVECRSKEDGSVEDGDTVGVNQAVTVKLVESTPLVVAAAGFEVDDFLGIPTDGKFTGYVLELWAAKDFASIGTRTVRSQEVCSDGCFDLIYTVEIISAPPALASGAEELPPPEYVTLPAGLSRLLPEDAELPDGVRRSHDVYLPWISK